VCRFDDLGVEPLSFSAAAASLTSLKARCDETHIRRGTRSRLMAAASISFFSSAEKPVVATTSGICEECNP